MNVGGNVVDGSVKEGLTFETRVLWITVERDVVICDGMANANMKAACAEEFLDEIVLFSRQFYLWRMMSTRCLQIISNTLKMSKKMTNW